MFYELVLGQRSIPLVLCVEIATLENLRDTPENVKAHIQTYHVRTDWMDAT